MDKSTPGLVVADRGEDYTIRVEEDGFGFVHVICERSDGAKADLPRFSPGEAEAFANLLSPVNNSLSAHKACVEALKRYQSAIRALGERGPNRVTYFEGNVVRDGEAQVRWQELDAAGKQAAAALEALEKANAGEKG